MFEDVVEELRGCPAPSLDADGLLEMMTGLQRLINVATAAQLRCVGEFAQGRPAPAEPVVPGAERARWGAVSEFASAEIGAALRLARRGRTG